MEIRRLTISYSKHKEKQQRIQETELQKRLAVLETKINNCNMDEQLSAEFEDYDNLKLELQHIYCTKPKGKVQFFDLKSGGLNKVKNLQNTSLI